jgi:hypothetical protein
MLLGAIAHGTPEQLRAIAKIDRERGDLESAERHEGFADIREKEEIEKDWEETHGHRLEEPEI